MRQASLKHRKVTAQMAKSLRLVQNKSGRGEGMDEKGYGGGLRVEEQ